MFYLCNLRSYLMEQQYTNEINTNEDLIASGIEKLYFFGLESYEEFGNETAMLTLGPKWKGFVR